MSGKRLVVLVVLVLCFLPNLLRAEPETPQPAALNPDVGDAQLVLDLFVTRSTEEVDIKQSGVAVMFGLSSRMTGILQFAKADVPWSENKDGLLVEGRVRFYLGRNSRTTTAGQR